MVCRHQLLIAGICLLSIVGPRAQATEPRITTTAYDIESQPLGDALNAFAEQSGLQLVFYSTIGEGLVAPRLTGTFSPRAALDQLLANTSLSYEFADARSVIIRARGTEGAALSKTQDALVDANRGMSRLAQTDEQSEAMQKAQGFSGGNEGKDSDAYAGDLGTIEEIVVTAQRRKERLQDVPISISVLSGDKLDSSTVRDVTEALSRVPGVAIGNDIQGGTMQVTMRGVASEGAIGYGGPTAAYYLDSAPFGFVSSSFAPPTDTYDLDRVEVLRGPQGTLYGANALNGVVRVLTRDADLSEFEFKARGFSSNTEEGDWNYRGDMAVNVPIVSGKLAARAVVGYENSSGWIDKPNQKDVNGTDSRMVRLKLNAQPTEQLSIGLSAWLSELDLGGLSVANEEMQRSYPGDEPTLVHYEVYNLKVGYEFPGISVTSMTSYLDYENEYTLGLVDLGPSLGLFRLPAILPSRTFAQEMAVSSTHAGAWQWTAGAMYRDSNDRYAFSLPPLVPGVAAGEPSSQSYAIFGELTRRFIDGRWALTLGGRYFEDRVRLVETSRSVPFTPDQLITRGETFHATTPRVILTWHPGPQLNLYASFSQGFRSGWSQSPLSPLPDVEPDKLTNYELGSKGSFLGGRLALDAALYYMDWRDLQQTLLVAIPGSGLPCPNICTQGGVNGESASGIGMDFSVIARPINALELGLNAGWNDLTMDEPVFTGGVLLFDKGDRLNTSVEYTLGTFGDYVFPLGTNGYEGQFSLSANYTSGRPSRFVSGNQLTVRDGDPMLIARASFSIRAADHWTTTLFVDNLNNENHSPGPSTTGEGFRIRPRTVGLQLEYHFE